MHINGSISNVPSHVVAQLLLCHYLPSALRRSFAGEALERERFGTYVNMSYHSGVGFAGAKANLEALSRYTMHIMVRVCLTAQRC